jgi:hypothetical protein
LLAALGDWWTYERAFGCASSGSTLGISAALAGVLVKVRSGPAVRVTRAVLRSCLRVMFFILFSALLTNCLVNI